MRAVGITRFGGPEVLEIVELPKPQPGDGQVRIKVAAATVNATDTVLRTGRHGPPAEGMEPPYVPGMELAGIIDLAAVPDGVSLAAAATLPMNGLTARLALDLLALKPGETLAVTGAAGAVGGYAVQLAAVEGLRTIADAASADADLVRGFGADVVVERGPEVAAAIRRAVPDGVDAVLDAALIGGSMLAAVRDKGQLAAVRSFRGESERRIKVTLVLVGSYLHAGAKLAQLAALADVGKLTLRVADEIPAEQAAEAHRRLQAGNVRGQDGARGRLVLTF
jgi:NADPH2:quinone reductase